MKLSTIDKQDMLEAPAKPEEPCIRERILDVAEHLFAQKGIAETSVRAITTEAGVNVAAINYYFGSRDKLFEEVVSRRLTPLNEERRKQLDACQQNCGAVSPTVEELLTAFAVPGLLLCFQHPYFARLASRLRLDADSTLWREYRARQMPLLNRFQEAFAAALPDLSEDEVYTRLHYILGAIQHVWAHSPLPEDQTPEKVVSSFLTFYGAALRAPMPK